MRDLTLGSGKDYVYRGRMNFTGMHQDGQIELSRLNQENFCWKNPLRDFFTLRG